MSIFVKEKGNMEIPTPNQNPLSKFDKLLYFKRRRGGVGPIEFMPHRGHSVEKRLASITAAERPCDHRAHNPLASRPAGYIQADTVRVLRVPSLIGELGINHYA
jgi:hypothetical protein